MANGTLQSRLTKSAGTSTSKAKRTPIPKPTTTITTKRKRSTDDGPDVESEHEEISDKKKAKANPKKPSISKSTAKNASPAQKAYQAAMENIDKKASALDKKVRSAGPNSRTTNSDTYAKAMVTFIKDVKSLSKDDIGLAFNLMMEMGTRSRCDLKMCGYGESEESYAALDEVMVGLIEKRKEEGEGDGKKYEVRKRWEEKDAEDVVGPYKTGRPNKQQRGQLERHRMKWNEERSKELRIRREKSVDWVGTALGELEEDAEYIGRYGLEGYFVTSREMLKELKGSKSPANEAS